MRPTIKSNCQEDQHCKLKNIISLYEGQKKNLICYCFSICGNIQMAEDIVQNTFLILLQKNNFNKIENLDNYMYRCIKLNTYNQLKTIKNRNRILDVVYTSQYRFNAKNDKDYDFLKENIIIELINSLPEKRRQVFIMKRIENKSLKEISEELGVSCKTVENQCRTDI